MVSLATTLSSLHHLYQRRTQIEALSTSGPHSAGREHNFKKRSHLYTHSRLSSLQVVVRRSILHLRSLRVHGVQYK